MPSFRLPVANLAAHQPLTQPTNSGTLIQVNKTAQDFARILELGVQKLRYSLRGRFSHANEQQILREYIDELVPRDYPRTVVDIGAGNGVRWSNSYALVVDHWKALGIEADPEKYALLTRAYRGFPDATACHLLASPQNIPQVLRDFGIEREFGVLSLDIDGNDYWVLDAILSEFRPGIVVTEINENIPPPLRFVVKFNSDFQLRSHFFGYSISALQDLCDIHGYGILKLEYNNAFLAPKELASRHFRDADSVYREGYLDRPERHTRFASNVDMEPLQTMNPEDAMQFVKRFFSDDDGKYYLSTTNEHLQFQL